MDDDYVEHTVSVKVALYSPDGQTVLVMKYPHHQDGPYYGLPGGHLEANETPDQALIRELDEELGIFIPVFEKKSFFLRSGNQGSVILAYSAVAPEGLVLKPTYPEKEYAIWMTAAELGGIENISGEYIKLVTENWPNK
jgi:8-oxo-dGTP pyrophosphatase MutT (NUDIX family)